MMASPIRREFLSLCLGLLVAVGSLGFAGGASAQDEFILGVWSLSWEGARDNYTGTLNVRERVATHGFKARLTLHQSGGRTVKEDALITVTGNKVDIECSNPSVKPWNPDHFYVVRDGNRMEGYSLDAAGARGRSIVFNKR